MNAPHRVRRVRVRLGVGGQAQALAARTRLRALWDTGLLPAMERTFDTVCPPDVELHVPRLELHLRLDSLDALDRLPELVAEALAARLRELAGAAVWRSAPPGQEEDAQALLRRALASPEEAPEGASLRALRAPALERLLRYLARGVLPGGALDEPPRRAALAALAVQEEALLLTLLAQGELPPAALVRWVALVEAPARPALLERALEAVGAGAQAELVAAWAPALAPAALVDAPAPGAASPRSSPPGAPPPAAPRPGPLPSAPTGYGINPMGQTEAFVLRCRCYGFGNSNIAVFFGPGCRGWRLSKP